MSFSPADISTLHRLRSQVAWLQFELKLLVFGMRLKAGFDPSQPRVSAGNPDGGQWTNGAGRAGRLRVADIIRVCITVGSSILSDQFGNKTYKRTYECFGGRKLIYEDSRPLPGLILEPF